MKTLFALTLLSLCSPSFAQDKKICVNKILPVYKTASTLEASLTFEGQNFKAEKTGDLVVYAEKRPILVNKFLTEQEIRAQFCSAKAPKGNASFFLKKWSEAGSQRVSNLGIEVQAPKINSINVEVGSNFLHSATCSEGLEGNGQLIVSCE